MLEFHGEARGALDPSPAGSGDGIYAELTRAFGEIRRENARVVESLGSAAGVSDTALRALNHVRGNPGSTPRQLADAMGLTTGGATSVIDRLVGAGMIERAPHPEDRRSVLLEVTPAGERVISQAFEVYEEIFREVVAEDAATELRATFLAVATGMKRFADARSGGGSAGPGITAG